MFPVWTHWDGKYTRKGLVKLALGRILKIWMLLSAVYATVFAVRNGTAKSREALADLVSKARMLLREITHRVASAV